ncbi:MAG: aminoacyl-tRNA hydrolase [Spirochaetales bacterium]|nr:aminoacyl-tRNA hydrolase [Spirochaetales bacterium]
MNYEKIRNWIHQNGGLSFSRSGGPGGQYVNTSDTKVILRLSLDALPLLEQEKQKVLLHLANRINSKKELIVRSSNTRSQFQNRLEAEELAFRLIKSALENRKKRHLTKPTRASIERRIKSKKIHGKKKQQRRKLSV